MLPLPLLPFGLLELDLLFPFFLLDELLELLELRIALFISGLILKLVGFPELLEATAFVPFPADEVGAWESPVPATGISLLPFGVPFSGEEVGESVAPPLGIGLKGGMIFMLLVFF